MHHRGQGQDFIYSCSYCKSVSNCVFTYVYKTPLVQIPFQSNLNHCWVKSTVAVFLAQLKILDDTEIGVYTIMLPEALQLNYHLGQIVIFVSSRTIFIFLRKVICSSEKRFTLWLCWSKKTFFKRQGHRQEFQKRDCQQPI